MPHVLRRLAAASGLAFLVCGPAGALAADLPPPPPPPEIRSDWTGPYVGGLLGLACMETHYIPSSGPDPELNGCGFMGGVLGGWNYQMGSFVIGVEGDIAWGGHTAENILDAVDYDIDNIATLRGRLGFVSYANTLIYGTAGVGWVKGTMDALVGPFSLPASDTHTHFGFVVGGGIEHAFTPNFHGRLEYLYGSFNDKTYDLSVSTCGTPCFADLDFDQLHLVRASLIWHFGGLFY